MQINLIIRMLGVPENVHTQPPADVPGRPAKTIGGSQERLYKESSSDQKSQRPDSNAEWSLEGVMLAFELAALVEFCLSVLEGAGYLHADFLPLGGGQLAQLGLIFAVAYVVRRLVEIFSQPPRRRRSQRPR